MIDVADTIVSNPGKDAREFLKGYFNSGVEREQFATLLSRRQWRGVFGYLTVDLEVPEDVRIALVDAALRGVSDAADYQLSSGIGRFIEDNCTAMKAFTASQQDQVAAKIVSITEEAGAVLPDLTPLDEVIRALIVQAGLYRITADNLRVALSTDGDVSLDRVRGHQAVYDLCRRFPAEYLAAVEGDERTPYSVLTESVLVEVLAEPPDSGDDEPTHLLIELASPDIAVELSTVPHQYWPDLAKRRLFRATVPNLQAYRVGIGSFDEPIAQLLVNAGNIDSTGADENAKSIVAVHLLNSADTIPDAGQRVALVLSMQPEDHLPVGDIEPEGGRLLALLLKEDLVEDSIESFLQFRAAGWSAIEPAIEQSENFPDFMTPELVSNFIPDLLRSNRVPEVAKEKVLDELALYVPHGDAEVFSTVGAVAITLMRSLPPDQIDRIAAVTGDVNLTLRLLIIVEPSVPEVVSVLAKLGEPYSYFTDTGVSEFKLPADTSHETILERLRDDGVVTSFRKVKDSYNVKRG